MRRNCKYVLSWTRRFIPISCRILQFSNSQVLLISQADELNKAMHHISLRNSAPSQEGIVTEPSELQLKSRSPSMIPLLHPRPRLNQIESAGAVIVQMPRGTLLVGVLVWHVPCKVVMVVVDA